MRHEILEYLKERLEEKYGDLYDESGCSFSTDHGWELLSPAEITRLIDEVDEEY